MTLCFDGTNNHEPSDKLARPPTTTNVARLYHASIGPGNGEANTAASDAGFFRYYLPGVGTEFKEIGEVEPSAAGLKYATGGENRINWALTRLLDVLLRELGEPPMKETSAYTLIQDMATNRLIESVSLGQMSNGQAQREAALRPELDRLQAQIAARPKPELLGLQLYVYGFSRGAAQARTFVNWLAALTRQADGRYRFAGIDLCVEFLGLFDTVASVGVADLAPFADGHMGWANGTQRLPDDEHFLRRCVHLVAAHEQRACFPLDSIRRQERPDDPSCPSTYRAGSEEYLYPGVHSDVGGGYPPGDQGKALAGGAHVLSQAALHHMYDAAYRAGAPLQVPEMALNAQQLRDWPWLVMDAKTYKEFDIADELIVRFNTWAKQLSGGPLEEAMARELALLTGWRIERFVRRGQEHLPYYQHCRGRDMSPEEREAFETLHRYQLAEDAAARKGEEVPSLSTAQQAERERAQATCRAYAARTGGQADAPLNTHKAFEPMLDQRQLANAAREFRRDYVPEWSFANDSGFSSGQLLDVMFGGLVYMTNDVDEADEYTRIRTGGDQCHGQLFTADGNPASPQAAQLIALFDEQVHDSRAWFMNAQLNARELWSDYFRYRCIFFDSLSNKRLSLLANGVQVIGIGIALASVGLAVKRRDPRWLVGLMLPSLGTPVLRGKVSAAQVSAFDPLTGLALPMLEVADGLRGFSQDRAPALRLAAELPIPMPLTPATADSPALQAILQARLAAAEADNTRGPTWLTQVVAALD
ncbi:hypothetical protein D9M69_411160 [compost metagenome]